MSYFLNPLLSENLQKKTRNDTPAIVVDDELSPTSTNPVQNCVIDAALKNLTPDTELSTTSEKSVQNKVVTTELQQKVTKFFAADDELEDGEIAEYQGEDDSINNLENGYFYKISHQPAIAYSDLLQGNSVGTFRKIFYNSPEQDFPLLGHIDSCFCCWGLSVVHNGKITASIFFIKQSFFSNLNEFNVNVANLPSPSLGQAMLLPYYFDMTDSTHPTLVRITSFDFDFNMSSMSINSKTYYFRATQNHFNPAYFFLNNNNIPYIAFSNQTSTIGCIYFPFDILTNKPLNVSNSIETSWRSSIPNNYISAISYYNHIFETYTNSFQRVNTQPVPAVDSALSSTSTNAVQNAVVYAALLQKLNKTFIKKTTLTITSDDNGNCNSGYYITEILPLCALCTTNYITLCSINPQGIVWLTPISYVDNSHVLNTQLTFDLYYIDISELTIQTT